MVFLLFCESMILMGGLFLNSAQITQCIVQKLMPSCPFLIPLMLCTLCRSSTSFFDTQKIDVLLTSRKLLSLSIITLSIFPAWMKMNPRIIIPAATTYYHQCLNFKVNIQLQMDLPFSISFEKNSPGGKCQVIYQIDACEDDRGSTYPESKRKLSEYQSISAAFFQIYVFFYVNDYSC